MPRDRKESDVPNDSEDESSSEDSSGSDSGSHTTDSNASESDPKKASCERHDVSHKTGSPGSAGRSTKVSSSGRGKDRSGDSRPDHGCDSDNHKPKAISREKTDEKAKGRDTEGDVSSDGEQMTRSGPRSTIVQKSSVARKDEGTERGEESSKWTPFKEPEKRDRERHGEEREGQRRRRSRSRSPKTRDSSRGKDHRGRDEKSRKLGSSRKLDGRRQEERQQDYDRSRRDREADNRKRERDEGNAENERSRHDREASGQRKIRAEGRQDSDRLRRDRDRDIGRQVRDDGRKERDGPNTRSDDRDRWHDREPGEGNDDKENHRDDNTSRKRQAGESEQAKEKEEMGQPAEKKAKTAEEELLTSRTGGAYIPPARLRMLQAQITDKSSVAYQRMAWEALKKSINGLINKVNVSNIVDIVRELFQENIVRGRGLLGRSVTQAQAASPTFTHVYAALVAIINTKFPQIGELILQRLILQFKRGYRRNDKNLCMASTRFIGHLVNQQVAHEVISLEILTLLLENISEDSVEVAISFLKECGQKLSEVSPKGINAIFERLRSILHEGQIDKRVQYMVEVMFAIRKDDFKDHPAVIADLDLVEEDDQFTHLLTLEDVTTAQDELNVFRADDRYLENEEKYKTLKKEILAEGSSDEDSGDEDSASESSSEEEEEEEEGKQDIIDNTETNMVALRRTIYLTIQSSLDFEECAHKLLKMEMKPGQEVELCYMILDCCAQLRTYEKFFGLLAQRFCQLDKKYVEPYQNIFREQFETIHRLDTNKLRNVAKFFGHLLHTDAISWGVMSCMKLTEEDTTSASRIFIKILFIELAEYMGLPKLNARLRDPTLQEYFEGIMPRNNPKDTRFAINFFTTIGLGGLTEDLREHLKGLSKQLMQQKQQQQQQDQVQSTSTSDSSESGSSDSGSSDSSESDSSDSDTSESDSESSDSSSESEADKKRKKKKDLRQESSSRMLQERRETSRRDLAREQQDAISVNGVGRADGRPRIEDKLLRLSLGGEAPTIDFSHTHAASNPPQDRSKRGNRQKGKRGFRNKRQGRRNRRLSAADSSARGRRNSDCDHWANSSYDGHNSDRDRGDVGMERDYYRGDRMPRDDRISSRPRTPDMDSRRERRYLASEDVMVDRRGRRRDVDISPRADRAVDMRSPRRDHRDVDGSPPRRDRRPIDMSPRHVDSRDVLSPRRRGRADVLSPTGRGLESSPRRAVREPGSISNRGDRRDITSPRLADRRDYDIAPSRRDRREVVSPGRGDYEGSPLARDGRRERMDIYRREGDRSPPLGSRNEQKQLEHSRNGSRRGGAEHYSHNDGRSIAKSVSPNPVRESRKEKKRSKEREGEGTARRQSVSPDSSDHQKHSGRRDRPAVSSRTKDRRRR